MEQARYLSTYPSYTFDVACCRRSGARAYIAETINAQNEDGSKTYTMTINDGLVWSDGSPITAKDYVFELLLENGPTMIEIGYPGANMNVYVGYEEYNEEKNRPDIA